MIAERVLIAGLALLVAGVPSAPAAETARPSLSGRWTLNARESEDAREKMRQAGGGRRGPGGGGGGERGPGGGGPRGGGPRGGGFGGRGPRGGGPGGGREGGDRRESMRAVFEAPPEITITHTSKEIALLEKDGRLRALHPDGKGYQDTGGAEVKTRWDDARLVVETRPERGPKVVETFVLEAEPRRLVVNVRLETPSGTPVTVRRVYDAAEQHPQALY